MKLILYHGTSEKNAKQIEKEGFVPDTKHNWKVKSKKGFVYLSSAYAPFYCMNASKGDKLALVKVEVDTKDCYPEDDYLMLIVKNIGAKSPEDIKMSVTYTQEELDKVNLEDWKHLWKDSLNHMGNVAVRPDKIKILGIRSFDGKELIMKCDPVISVMNFKVMGDYYNKLSEWIFEGKQIKDFPSQTAIMLGISDEEVQKRLGKL